MKTTTEGTLMKQKQQTIQLADERGQSLTEFALALPILALLLFAIIQFGIVFNNYVTLTDATRAGARKGAVARRLPNPTQACMRAVTDSAGGLSQKPGFSASCTPSNNWQPGSDVTVRAQYPYQISLLGLVVKNGNLSSTTTERVE
jgi:Flp pilus assembly protein TadG